MSIKSNFSGFIWSPAKKFKDEILEHINKKFPVLHYYTYDFKNKEEFKNSVLDIYTTDDISPEKVENIKIKNMLNHSLSYTYFQFYIKEPKFRKKHKTNNNISTSVENIKKQIRQIYKSKVTNYIYDIIIHISDNFKQTKDIDIIMKKYEKHRKQEFVNLKYFLKCNFRNNVFNRADMLVRKHSIENYLKDEKFNFLMYKKMQKIRVNGDGNVYVNKFKNLIKSIKKNGFINSYPIIYSSNYQLTDGSHRLSIYFLFNKTFIPVYNDIKKSILKYKRLPSEYSINWFIKKNFTKNELSIIENEIKNLKKYLNLP
uniref:ParB/Sulfiredoxin domain-containing protein n=1 Tax=viral metagenome TaxID=1070528 RepID=A0A6C0LX48_9ZZZZ